MAVPDCQLNRFEQFLFWAALIVGGVFVAVRIGAMLLLTFLRHAH